MDRADHVGVNDGNMVALLQKIKFPFLDNLAFPTSYWVITRSGTNYLSNTIFSA